MTQELYAEIINSIRYGAPANADKLIVALNEKVKDEPKGDK